MNSRIGFRINEDFVRPSAETIQSFKGIPTSNIADYMERLYCIDAAIRPMNAHWLLGSAFTVKVPMGDNLMLHKALDMAMPGDIIVVDGEGNIQRALAGEMMVTYAARRGIAGLVADAYLRDLDALRQASIPVYARGITSKGPYKNGPGEINVPICCGGQVVMPGDILVGDMDGLIVIRQADALGLAERARNKFNDEKRRLKAFEEGALTLSDRSWVDSTLGKL